MSALNKKRLLIGITLMLGGYFAALASVPFLGYGWQFLHGSSIVFAGWRIPVPAGFYMTEGERSRTLWRLSIGMPIRKGPYGQITLFHQSKPVSGREFDRDLEAGFVRAAQIEGYALSAKRELRVADTRAVCFEFTRFGEQDCAVRCAVENGAVWPWYTGTQ